MYVCVCIYIYIERERERERERETCNVPLTVENWFFFLIEVYKLSRKDWMGTIA